MKRFIITIFITVWFVSAAFSQQQNITGLTTNYTEELIQDNVFQLGVVVLNDIMQINQIGNNNDITSIQQLNNRTPYISSSIQNGQFNQGYMNQSGPNHETQLSQDGNHNNASLWSVGANTKSFVQQTGNNNTINSYIENNFEPSRTASAIQFGDDNKANIAALAGETMNLQGISLVQSGNGNMVELILDHFDAPYMKVEQTGGATISITHSDFNFPTK